MELTIDDRDKVLEISVRLDTCEESIDKEDIEYLIKLVKELDEGWPQ